MSETRQPYDQEPNEDGLVIFGDDFTPPPIPGEARDYWAMLHALLKNLAMNAGVEQGYSEEQRRAAKISLAEWSQGINDNEAGAKVRADVENLVRLNKVAPSLEELWAWRDDPNT